MENLYGLANLMPVISRIIDRIIELLLQKPIWFLNKVICKRVVRIEGKKVYFHADNWITNYRVNTFFTKEPETLDWLRDNLQAGDTFFDVGANIGLYSIFAATCRADVSILAFEPEYSNLYELKTNINLNRYWGRITPFSLAFDKQSGPSLLHIQDELSGAALSSQSQERTEWTKSGKRVIFSEGIATYSLDEFCKKWDASPTLIKIDVDGTEDLILAGGRKVLEDKGLRSILIEVGEHTASNCRLVLEESGFTFIRMHQGENQIWERLG